MGCGGWILYYCFMGIAILGCISSSLFELIMLCSNGLQIIPLLGSLISLVGICTVMTRDRIKGYNFEIYSESFKLSLIFGIIQFLLYLPIKFDDDDRIFLVFYVAFFGQVTKCFIGYVVSSIFEEELNEKSEKYQKYLLSYYQNQAEALNDAVALIKESTQITNSSEKLVNLFDRCGYKKLKKTFCKSDNKRNNVLIATLKQNLVGTGLDLIQDDMTIAQIQKAIELQTPSIQEKVEYYNKGRSYLSDYNKAKAEYESIPIVKEKRRNVRQKAAVAIFVLSAAVISIIVIYEINRTWNAHKIYTEALTQLNQGHYIAANDMLESIQWYKDSEVLIENQKYDVEHEYLSAANVGDIVNFGECNNGLLNTNGPILWIVLKKENGKILLLSKDVLTSKPYNSLKESTTWKDTTLREWLNQTFYTEVFSSREQEWVEESQILNNNNEIYGTPAGENTIDKLFLLSTDEVDDLRQSGELKEVSEWWWLRSPGLESDCAARVSTDGKLTLYRGAFVNRNGGVRPAMWVK